MTKTWQFYSNAKCSQRRECFFFTRSASPLPVSVLFISLFMCSNAHIPSKVGTCSILELSCSKEGITKMSANSEIELSHSWLTQQPQKAYRKFITANFFNSPKVLTQGTSIMWVWSTGHLSAHYEITTIAKWVHPWNKDQMMPYIALFSSHIAPGFGTVLLGSNSCKQSFYHSV